MCEKCQMPPCPPSSGEGEPPQHSLTFHPGNQLPQKIPTLQISLQCDSLVIKVQTGKAVAGFTGLCEHLVDICPIHILVTSDISRICKSFKIAYWEVSFFFFLVFFFFFLSFDLLEEFWTLTVTHPIFIQLSPHIICSTLVQQYHIPALFLRSSAAKSSSTALSLSSTSQSSVPRFLSVGKSSTFFVEIAITVEKQRARVQTQPKPGINWPP